MIELAEDRWFPLVNLSLAIGAGTLWYLTSGRIGWPLLVAILVPWMMRIAAGYFPFRRSRFDGLLLLFGITAVIGIFTAYDTNLARGKFWILLGAMAIYFGIVSLSRRDVWRLAGATGPLGASLALYFVMSNNWRQWPAEIGLFNRIGGMWMSLRPSLPLPVLHPNTLGGMMALLLPFNIAFGIYAWRQRRMRWLQLAVVSGAITVGGLLFSSSIGAWLAVAVGLGIWFLWEISNKLRRKLPFSQKTIFIGFMVGLFLLGLMLLSFLLRLGVDSATRLGLAQQTLFLIEDFGLTGSGLATFPALYAQYVQVTPVFFAAYSNFFLDIWLEQGIFALVSMLIVLGGSFWLLLKQSAFWTQKSVQQPVSPAEAEAIETTWRRRRRRRRNTPLNSSEMVLFRWAAFASMVVMILHGLIDDALYGDQASPLLFFAPAMVILVTRRSRQTDAPPISVRRYWVMGFAVTAVLLAALFVGFRQTVQAQWAANLGALQLARAELVGWPTNKWDTGEDLQRFDAATALFEQALAVDSQNRTANHRLGMIAMVKRDYETAVFHLEQAQAAADSHRGITKSLGYSYVWNNQLDQAAETLLKIPESRAEMSVYANWWEQRNRPDLAAKASEMSMILQDVVSLNP
jgi:tetratricopeptide (TPR) repeat protein